MPVLESTEFTTPRSALRHRPIGDDSKQQERLSPNTSAPTPIVQRASRTRTTTDASVEVDEWERASGNSAGSVAAQPGQGRRGVPRHYRPSEARARHPRPQVPVGRCILMDDQIPPVDLSAAVAAVRDVLGDLNPFDGAKLLVEECVKPLEAVVAVHRPSSTPPAARPREARRSRAAAPARRAAAAGTSGPGGAVT